MGTVASAKPHREGTALQSLALSSANAKSTAGMHVYAHIYTHAYVRCQLECLWGWQPLLAWAAAEWLPMLFLVSHNYIG